MIIRQGLSRFIVLIAAATCVAGLADSRPLFAQSVDKIKQDFQNPPKQYRPMVRWWWPGADVSDDEIRREIGLLDTAGFGGAEIQPFVTFDTRKLPEEEVAKINQYATPPFFDRVRTAMDTAKSHGMWIDYTFGTGWPFGGGSTITPELSAIELRFADTTVEGPKSFSGKLEIPQWKPDLLTSMMIRGGLKPQWPDGWNERFEARSKIVAVVAMKGTPERQPADGTASGPRKPDLLDQTSAVILTERMKSDGSLDWDVPAGTWHLFVFRQIPTEQPVIGASGTGPQLVLDHLNEAAFAAHARRVGDPLVAEVPFDIGSSFRAIFCDSLELQQYIFWSDDFIAQFKKRRGYDLTPYLAILRQPGYNDFYFSHPGGYPLYDVPGDGDVIRADYWKTVSELITEGFYQPFDDWARKHNLLSRVQAHGAPADILKLYGMASIPETEQLAGGNTVNFMKLASSAGYDYGRKIVSSESFVFMGNPYITTPESIKANSDKLFISGVNQIVYHGFPYKFNDGLVKGIGWFPFQAQFSSHINEDNPIWPFIPKVNQYITRLQYVSQSGTNELQVALFRSSLNEEDTGSTPATGPVKNPFPEIEEGLTSAGYSFGTVNEDVLLNSSATDGKLLAKGGGHYQVLVIPHEAGVSPELVKALKAFADARVPIVFVGGPPGPNVTFVSMKMGRESVASGLQNIESTPAAIQVAGAAEVAGGLRERIEPQVRFTSGDALPFVKKTIGTMSFYLFTNPAKTTKNATIAIAEKRTPEIWDPWTGSVNQATYDTTDGGIAVAVSLPPFGSELLAFGDTNRNTTSAGAAAWTEMKRQDVGASGWEVEAVGDSDKGVGMREHLKMATLTDWTAEPVLRTFSGKAAYSTHVTVSPDDLRNAGRVVLDLGDVKDPAEVTVNGVSAGQLVVHPFAVDIRSLLRPGENDIQVTVVNSLTNYMSSVQLPKVPGSQMRHYDPIPAGLLGPVSLLYEKESVNK
jgi:hypothetical protein